MICKIYDKVCSSIVYSILKVKPLLSSLVCIARPLCSFGGGGGVCVCVCACVRACVRACVCVCVVVVVVALLLLLLLLL